MYTKLALSSTIIAILTLFLISCKSGGDAETESKIDGCWESSYNQSDYEDGIEVTFKINEKITYDAETHKVISEGEWYMTAPFEMYIGQMHGEGSWSATKDKITIEYDSNSLNFDLDEDLFEQSDIEEMKKEFIQDNKGCKIVELTADKLVISEDGNDITFTRVK